MWHTVSYSSIIWGFRCITTAHHSKTGVMDGELCCHRESYVYPEIAAERTLQWSTIQSSRGGEDRMKLAPCLQSREVFILAYY